MVKAYLRYEFSGSFGVITGSANPEFDADGKHVLSGALESISVWNIKQGTQVAREPPFCRENLLRPPMRACMQTSSLQPNTPGTSATAEATVIARAPNSSSAVAVGYSDGSVSP